MFKKGDKVYSILKGWGEVTRIYSEKNMIGVMFSGSYEIYEKDGKKNINDLIPQLYHTEPTITVPKRRVEHKGWIKISNEKYGEINRVCSYIFDEKPYLIPDSLNTIQEITFYTEE